jgi:hypothetical protein
VIALARIHHHAETTAYYQRLLATGKTARRGTPLRQTRTRPLLLPPPRRDPNTRLDNIEASETVAAGCRRLRPNLDGMEGVDGSSPSEGLHEMPADRHF